ncbi:MAG: glycosyltransferase family 4 protein [Pirellulales bacterium]|jgi:hypothetical protein|nr:glycosyltransferase family 4 protein [Pirellulales bacterium]
MSRRILLVARGLDAVGSGRELLQTAHRLRAEGDDVHLATITRPAGVATRLAECGVLVHPLSQRPEPSTAGIAGIARTAVRLRPQLVMSWGSSAMQATAAALLAAPGRSRPRWLASLARPLIPKAPSHRQLTGRLLQHCDLILASTEATALACEMLGVAPGRLQISPAGIGEPSPPRLSREEVASQLGLPLHTTWTLCVAPLVARSRLERLVWAADQLDVVLRGLTHILVGHGPLGPQIARRARAQEASNRLHLLPSCSLIADLLTHVRLVWQTGEVAYGGALVDALAAGVPSVAVAGDAATSIIADRITGRLVPADPPSELPRHGLPYLEDDALCHQTATASRRRAREAFPLEPALQRQLTAINSLIS